MEWKLIQLAQDCLKVNLLVSETSYAEALIRFLQILTANFLGTPCRHAIKVYPLIERLQSQ